MPDVRFTPREAEVMTWAALGKTNWEISQILAISETTVKFHIEHCYEKLGVNSRTYAAVLAVTNDLIHLPSQKEHKKKRA